MRNYFHNQSVIPEYKSNKHYNCASLSNLIKTLAFTTLSALLPKSSGICLDLGCGEKGIHKNLIEQKGMLWFGLDIHADKSSPKNYICGNALDIPVRDNSVETVVSWQVLEHIPDPETAVKQISRILKKGGKFIGGVSFLEPLHENSQYNISPLKLHDILVDAGFSKIDIIPGINAFSLITWTLFRKFFSARLAFLGILLTALWFIPFATAIYTISKIKKRELN